MLMTLFSTCTNYVICYVPNLLLNLCFTYVVRIFGGCADSTVWPFQVSVIDANFSSLLYCFLPLPLYLLCLLDVVTDKSYVNE
jgi:hypothetical protein